MITLMKRRTTAEIGQELIAKWQKRQQNSYEYLQRDVDNSCSLWSRLFTKPGKRYGAMQFKISAAKKNPALNWSHAGRKLIRAMQEAGHPLSDVSTLLADLEAFANALYRERLCLREASLTEQEADAALDLAQLRYHDSPTDENVLDVRAKALAHMGASQVKVIAADQELGAA